MAAVVLSLFGWALVVLAIIGLVTVVRFMMGGGLY